MKNIVLIGMMGCGKSTCAKLLGTKLNRNVVDTDELIEQRTGKTIQDLFASEGEAYFRDVETQIAQELAKEENLIIATGGGLPLREVNQKALRENGIVFWLKRDPKEIFLTGSMDRRPLAQQGLDSFVERFHQREPYYMQAADHVIEDFSSLDATAEEILRHL